MKTNVLLRGLFASLLASISIHAATINWTNTAGGNWSVVANWSPHQLPGSFDTAVITNDGNYTVTMDVGPTLAGLVIGATNGVNTQTLSANGQTVTLNGQVTVNSRGVFSFINGNLSGATVLAGMMNWSGGTLNNSGSLTVASNGVLNIQGAIGLYSALTNNGTVNWQAGNVTVNYFTGANYFGAVWNQAGAQWNILCDQTMNHNNYSGEVASA